MYIKVKWVHSDEEYPKYIYSRLDDDNFEIRKIEVYADGKVGYADQDRESNGSMLGSLPFPPLDEITTDKQFELEVISEKEFEEQWKRSISFHNKD